MTRSTITSWPHVDYAELCRQCGPVCTKAVLKKWRESNAITQGVHWVYRPGTTNRILWNLELMRDFIAVGDQNNPAHKKAIERYLFSLPSSVA